MKRYFFLASILGFSGLTSAQYTFTHDKSLSATSVQDQQSTGTCWSFATSSFLESELLRQGKQQVDLSEMYTVRQIYFDKARNYLLRQGKANFAEGGLAHDMIHSFKTYGAVPETVYTGKMDIKDPHNHAELSAVLKGALDAMLEKKVVSERWPKVVNAILDVYLGPVPAQFTENNKQFTADSYAKSLGINADDYVSITSFTHHPFYDKFVLEIPDNFSNGSFYNVPLEDLMRITKYALDKGYTVAWDGDVSEKGFDASSGIAILPADAERKDAFTNPGPEIQITATDRQKQFEDFRTTDDHLMHLTGTAKDQSGNKYFIVKNSWGVIGAHNGYLYMSEPYFKGKTVFIMVHKDAIPQDIANRLTF